MVTRRSITGAIIVSPPDIAPDTSIPDRLRVSNDYARSLGFSSVRQYYANALIKDAHGRWKRLDEEGSPARYKYARYLGHPERGRYIIEDYGTSPLPIHADDVLPFRRLFNRQRRLDDHEKIKQRGKTREDRRRFLRDLRARFEFWEAIDYIDDAEMQIMRYKDEPE